MKPLSSYIYIKSNIKKVVPSFVCTIISVFLVCIFGLLLYGSVNTFNKLSVNIVKNGTIISSNSIEKPISNELLKEIKNDANVKGIVPMLGMNNDFRYAAAFGIASSNSYIVYSEDVNLILKSFRLELISGCIPQNNKDEIILPQELAKQYKLKVGDYITKDFSADIHVNKTYKLVGITKGESWLPIVCDVGETKRDVAMKRGLMFFFKDINNKSLNDKIIAKNDKNIVAQDYKSVKEEMNQLVSSINFLYISLVTIIILVLCISLSNLNYIIFSNRKSEFAILATIGFPKSKLRRKLFRENTIVCLLGFIVGIGITLLVTSILNVTVWQPKGQYIPILRLDSLLTSLLIPILVSVFSMLSSVRELNKLSYENLNM